MTAPTIEEIQHRLAHENLDEWLELWAIEQGLAKRPALELMAAVIPAPAAEQPLRVLDLCCGPGDLGRTIHAKFPAAEIDAVDRDIFLSQLCAAANRRAGVRGLVLVRDLNTDGWREGLSGSYDVVGVANALHWLRLERAREVLADIRSLLKPGGVFVALEPVSAIEPIAAGIDAWKAKQPPQHQWQDWLNFWTRVNDFMGYDHIASLGRREDPRIGDSLSASGWLDLVREAGFGPADVIWRDAEKAIVVACAPAML